MVLVDPLRSAGRAGCSKRAANVQPISHARGVSTTIRILGPVAVERSGEPVVIAPTLRLLLGLLASRPGQLVAVGVLGEALWGDDQPAAAAATLQSHVSRLRRALSPGIAIHSSDRSYRLVMVDGVIDAGEFARLVGEASVCTDPALAGARYAAALSWWQGPPFGDLHDHEHLRPEAVRLDEHRHAAVESWMECRLEADVDPALVGDLESLAVANPLRERYWRQLVVALHRSGRQAEALRRLAEVRTMLRDELGLDVPSTLRELEARVLADDPSLRAHDPAPRPRVHSSIADDPSPLVGRDEELVAVGQAIRDARLVTLVGPGGVGKTRMARRLAATSDEFDDDAAVVELAGLRDPAALAGAVANALDVQQRQHLSVDETLLTALAGRRQLLVLDNCEHLLDVVVPFVERIRTRCHGVHVLATSREPLGLPGEVVWPIVPLGVADVDVDDPDEVGRAPAVRLLIDRARAAMPGFVLTAANAGPVSELCRRLDGLPLALELAAARFRSLSPEMILERLGHSSRLLDTRSRTFEDRHRTLSDTIGWSYELLTESERALFRQLSVFAGSFDLEAVEAVCLPLAGPCAGPDLVELLVALVDKSMVQVIAHEQPRYQMLETLREYAWLRLDDPRNGDAVGGLGERHLRWYTALAERAEVGLGGPDEQRWSARIDADFGDFRAAHAFAVRTGDVDAALWLVCGLREYAFRRIRYELMGWAATSVQLAGADQHSQYPVVLAIVACGEFVRGNLASAITEAHRSVAAQQVSGGPSSGLAERSLGNALFYLGRTDEALVWMDRMVSTARDAESPARLAHALYMRSVAETSVGHTVRGAVLAGEAKAAAHDSGSPTASAQAAYALGLALEGTDLAESLHLLREAAATARAAGNRWIEAFALTEVWWIEARSGDVRDALAGSGEVIDTWHRGGDWANLWLSLRHVVGILQQSGDLRAAAVLHGALATAGATYAMPFEPSDAERLKAVVGQIRGDLGEDVFDRAASDGAALTEPALVAFVQERIAVLVAGSRS